MDCEQTQQRSDYWIIIAPQGHFRRAGRHYLVGFQAVRITTSVSFTPQNLWNLWNRFHRFWGYLKSSIGFWFHRFGENSIGVGEISIGLGENSIGFGRILDVLEQLESNFSVLNDQNQS